MEIIETGPKVWEGDASERGSGENTPLSCKRELQRHEIQPSEGGPSNYSEHADMTHVWSQQSVPPSATTPQHPGEQSCEQEANNTIRPEHGQCIRSKPRSNVGR